MSQAPKWNCGVRKAPELTAQQAAKICVPVAELKVLFPGPPNTKALKNSIEAHSSEATLEDRRASACRFSGLDYAGGQCVRLGLVVLCECVFEVEK
jgi:hypothetical protein